MDTDVVNVRYPHESHGLARKTSNSSKKSVQDDFLQFVDLNSQPNGRNSNSFGALFYFLPTLVCEFNCVQEEEGRGKCSKRSAF